MKISSKKRFSKGWFTGVVLGVASSAAVVYATVVTIPNTFAPDTTISSADVNANFTAVKTAVDENDGRVTTNVAGIATNATNITANVAVLLEEAQQAHDVAFMGGSIPDNHHDAVGIP